MGRTAALRFRRSSAITVAAVILMISGLSLASWAPAYVLLVLLLPLAVAIWSWRSGTDADATGLRVRAALGTRRVAWTEVSDLRVDANGHVLAALTSGRALELTAVRPADLPALVAASGKELVVPSDDVRQGQPGDVPA